jgi:hypothetical protein
MSPNEQVPVPSNRTSTISRGSIIDHEAVSRRQSIKIRSESFAQSFNDFDESTTDAEKNMLLKSAPFHKFVLTGGPCGGKLKWFCNFMAL